jgi:hypothetical protein
MKYCEVLVVLLVSLAALVEAYPVRCQEVGDSVIGTVSDCDVQSDPLPFKWTATIKLKKACKWAGLDDVRFIYSNPDESIEGSCNTGATLPGNFSKNDNITIQQSCNSFSPPLEKGATLVVLVFYTHHDSFDDVLMYNFPIPGYVNQHAQPTLLSSEERQEIIRKIKDGSVKLQNLSVE